MVPVRSVVILVIEVDDLDLFPINREGEPPVLRDKQAPGTSTVAGKLMRLPARNRAQFGLLLHVLEKGDDLAQLGGCSGLNSGSVVLLDQPTQSFMDHVSDYHVATYHGCRVASSYAIRLLKGTGSMILIDPEAADLLARRAVPPPLGGRAAVRKGGA